MNNKKIDKWLLALLYLLAFVLIREWLLPVMELTNTDRLSLFLFFIILSFIFALVKLPWWLSVLLKFTYILAVIHYVFLEKLLFSKESLVALLNDLLSNVSIIFRGDWEEITNPLRTILFFILIWMTTYLIRHWIESRKSIFLFYMMTVLFIAVIDTFSEYSADGAIIRIMVTGLLLLGLLYITRLADKHKAVISLGAFTSIALPLVFAVVISGAFANVLPKQEPIWPDPIPFILNQVQGTGEGGGGIGVSKVGYDPDDSRLGGPFLQDNTLVMEAMVEKKRYWKIETKNTYTSKGWEQLPSANDFLVYLPGSEMGEESNLEEAEDEKQQRAKILMVEKFPFLLYPYGMTKAFADEDVSFLHYEATGQYRTKIGEEQGSLDYYEVDYSARDYSLKSLRETSMESLNLDISTEDLWEYLQLPGELPSRVTELAETITASSNNVYDKTKAIERYFGRSGFVYDQKNVAIPKNDEDYVDQFLFETKRGYCDNFSSSMVVMLRSIGIPARWVKGFAPGELSRNADDESIYRVTNNEAHSWVEAYMPGIGWMPFEPTIGFSGPATINYDIELDVSDPAVPEMREQQKEQPERAPEKVAKPKKDSKFSDLLTSIGTWLQNNKWRITAILGIVSFIVWRFFVSRRKWLPKVLVPAYRISKGNWNTFDKRYKSLLKQLNRFGIKRTGNTTLSDYAVQVDKYFGGEVMRNLTKAYEKGLYGGDFVNHNWESLTGTVGRFNQ